MGLLHLPAPLKSHPSNFFVLFFCSCSRLYKESPSGPHQPEGVRRSMWCWCGCNTGADRRSCKCPLHSLELWGFFLFLQALLGVVYSVTVECRAGGGCGQEAQGAAGKGEVPLQHGTANGYELTLVKYC